MRASPAAGHLGNSAASSETAWHRNHALLPAPRILRVFGSA